MRYTRSAHSFKLYILHSLSGVYEILPLKVVHFLFLFLFSFLLSFRQCSDKRHAKHKWNEDNRIIWNIRFNPFILDSYLFFSSFLFLFFLINYSFVFFFFFFTVLDQHYFALHFYTHSPYILSKFSCKYISLWFLFPFSFCVNFSFSSFTFFTFLFSIFIRLFLLRLPFFFYLFHAYSLTPIPILFFFN